MVLLAYRVDILKLATNLKKYTHDVKKLYWTCQFYLLLEIFPKHYKYNFMHSTIFFPPCCPSPFLSMFLGSPHFQIKTGVSYLYF